VIDYYLHKKCALMPGAKQNIRCKGCIWRDRKIQKCIFSIEFPRSISSKEFTQRIESVNQKQQNNLSEKFQRFIK